VTGSNPAYVRESRSQPVRLAFRTISLGGLALGLGITALLATRERQGQMSSSGESIDHHLDASGDREVVYCHQCNHEWYRDNHGLICPHCEGEATEIVSPSNFDLASGMHATMLIYTT
jgi:hypothetical protein